MSCSYKKRCSPHSDNTESCNEKYAIGYCGKEAYLLSKGVAVSDYKLNFKLFLGILVLWYLLYRGFTLVW
jgi:hypothetical protein